MFFLFIFYVIFLFIFYKLMILLCEIQVCLYFKLKLSTDMSIVNHLKQLRQFVDQNK